MAMLNNQMVSKTEINKVNNCASEPTLCQSESTMDLVWLCTVTLKMAEKWLLNKSTGGNKIGTSTCLCLSTYSVYSNSYLTKLRKPSLTMENPTKSPFTPSSSQRWQWRILQIWMNFPLKPPFTGGFPIAMFDDQRVPLKTMLLIVWPDGDGKNVMALGIFHLACAHEEHCGFSRLHGCFAWKPMKKNVCEKDPDVPTNFHVLGKRLCLSGRSIFTAYWLLMNQNIILYHAYWLGTHISSAPYRLFHPEMAPRHEEWGGAPKLPNSNKTFEFPNGCAMLKEAHSRLLGIVPSPQYETPWNTL